MIEVDNTVRVKDASAFTLRVALKVKDRDGVVEWVGTDDTGRRDGYECRVRFLPRNGRGKQFLMRVAACELVVQPKEQHAN